jgi:hypothetical protein
MERHKALTRVCMPLCGGNNPFQPLAPPSHLGHLDSLYLVVARLTHAQLHDVVHGPRLVDEKGAGSKSGAAQKREAPA